MIDSCAFEAITSFSKEDSTRLYSIYVFIYINLGSVPMVVSGEMFQVQDVCKEQILVRRHLGQEIQS